MTEFEFKVFNKVVEKYKDDLESLSCLARHSSAIALSGKIDRKWIKAQLIRDVCTLRDKGKSFRVTERERNVLRMAAKKEGVSVSTIVRAGMLSFLEMGGYIKATGDFEIEKPEIKIDPHR